MPQRYLHYILFFIIPITYLFSSASHSMASPTQSEYMAVPGLMDLRSTFSDGSHTIEELVQLARSRGFKVLFINDHDRIAISYGIPPFRNVFRLKKEFPSIMTNKPEAFLQEIQRIAEKYPEMIIIPGCETSAYYYWSGSIFKKNLTLHQFDRRLLVINLNKPDDYKHIPNLHNSFTFKYTKKLLPHALIYLIPLAMGIYLIKRKATTRYIGLLFMILSILGMMDTNPFRSSLFTPYQGDQGIRPYQELIDYVHDQGGLSFWNYPEQRSGNREVKYHLPIGFMPDISIQAHTPPYPQVLLESKGYTGFSALYGDHITAIDPGREWDKALNEYCREERESPPWGISTADFHQDGRLGLKLGAFPTTFLVKNFSKQDILEALNQGRFYCSRGDGYMWPKLDHFHVSNQKGQEAIMGETLITTNPPMITFRISMDSKNVNPKTIYLIRGGNLLQTYTGTLPLEIKYVDTTVPQNQKTYYRLMDKKEHFASNPIFVEYRPSR